MEEIKNVEIEETEIEMVDESKTKKFISGAWKGVKANWKKIAIGAVVVTGGVITIRVLGKKFDVKDVIDYAEDVTENIDSKDLSEASDL